MFSFSVKKIENGGKNLASFYVGVTIADKIGRKSGGIFLVSWCSFRNPYKIPGLDTAGLILV